MPSSELLATTIRERRIALHLTQAYVAAAAKLTPSYICKIEHGHTDYPPSYEAIAAIAKVLKLDEYQLQLQAGHIPECIKDKVCCFLLALENPICASRVMERAIEQEILVNQAAMRKMS